MATSVERLTTALGDRYTIERELGAGGMATVYLAQDLKHQRHVAVKVLRPELAAVLGGDRFLQEITVTANLQHPHILQLYDSGEADSFLYYVMPYVEGETLRDKLDRERQLSIDDAVTITTAIAGALDYAHNRGVIHRDIKPDNILLQDGVALMADFGIALAVTSAGGDRLTETGLSLGTPSYMSPEQVAGERELDARSDVYSLACVTYEMLAGDPPFVASSAQAILAKHVTDQAPPITTVRQNVNPSIADALARALNKTPVDRYDSARAFSAGLTAEPRDGEEPKQVVGAGNLPTAVDSFIARAEELASVSALLADAHLVTLVGVGGTGKTRLAIETAHRLGMDFTHGIWMAEFAPVTHADAIPHVVADIIGAVQQPGKTITQSVVDSLRHRTMLLVFDNCEHVLDAVADLATAITTQCDRIKIIATSRENLAIRGEQVMRLPSLADQDGAELFRDRAQAAGARGDMNMETLARLSKRLDGMPLAIELAAARCATMTPDEIEQRLGDRFRLLRGSRRGRMERHQTLHNTVAWSYELLDPVEQRVFDRLSVFAGGFTLDAARKVAGRDDVDPLDVEDAVTALVSRSMVLAGEVKEGTRYRLLETLRQFGEGRLAQSGDGARVREAHLRYFTQFMTDAWEGLWSPSDEAWNSAVYREYENLRVAVYAAVDDDDRDSIAALLKPMLFWAWHALRYEVADWGEAALDIAPEPAFARSVAIHLCFHGGRPDDVLRLSEHLAEPEDIGDPDEAAMSAWDFWNRVLVLGAGDDEVTKWMRRTIAATRRSGNTARLAVLTSCEVVFKVMAGAIDEAQSFAREAYALATQSGNQTALIWVNHFMGRAFATTHGPVALQHFERCIELADRIRIPLFSGTAGSEAALLTAQSDDPANARARIVRATRSFVNSGDLRQLWTSAHHLCYFLIRVEREEEARSIWRELRDRRGWTTRQHRDELMELLGEPGESILDDDGLVERIRSVLDAIEGDS